MSKRDYYDILGVAKGADDKALKSAYRKLAMKYHPDQNQGDEEAEAKFKEVGEAYAIIRLAAVTRTISFRIFSVRSLAAAVGVGAAGRSAAMTCAMIWISVLKRPSQVKTPP